MKYALESLVVVLGGGYEFMMVVWMHALAATSGSRWRHPCRPRCRLRRLDFRDRPCQ